MATTIKMLRSALVGNHRAAEVGEVLDLPDRVAEKLVGMGKAITHVGEVVDAIDGRVNEGDAVTVIEGIGPKTAEKLAGISIFTVEDLADGDVDAVAEAAGVTAEQAEDWQMAAVAYMRPDVG